MSLTHSFRVRYGFTLFAAMLLAVLVLTPGRPVGAVPAQGPDRLSTYNNPLHIQIPGDGLVESCADPSIIHGQTPGDNYWYIYCTTDPLNGQDKTPGGGSTST